MSQATDIHPAIEPGDQPIKPVERLTGMEALVRILTERSRLDKEAGLNTGGLASGYPGSPVGKLHDLLEDQKSELLTQGIHHRPGLNEELAATAVWGSQTVGTDDTALVDGVFALWYAKSPGVDRAGDALHHGNLRGTSRHGGVVLVAGDDPKPNATVYPSDSVPTLTSWGIPVLFPGTAQEVVELGLHAYEMSRASGLWTSLKMVTAIADGSGIVKRSDFAPMLPKVVDGGTLFVPALRHNDAGVPMVEAEKDMAVRQRVAAEYARINNLNPITVAAPDAKIGIVAPGKTYYDLRAALNQFGLDDAGLERVGIRVKKVSVLFPIAQREWLEFAEGLETVLVVEEKRPHLETAIKDAWYGHANAPRVFGKGDAASTILPGHGELTADMVADALRPVLENLGVADLRAPKSITPGVRTMLPLATARTGFFCSGCPHSTGLKAPEDAKVGAGIGCHILGLLVDRDEYGDIEGYTQMGGEGAQWIGMSPFVSTDHIFQNVGDGTFHHSASLSIRWAVAIKARMTFKILFNSTVGMTGGQDISGGMAVPELVKNLLAEGVSKIVVTTDEPWRYKRGTLPRRVKVHPRDEIIEVQEQLAKEQGVTVLIHDQQCAADRRRNIKEAGDRATTKVLINERVCEGCGDCNAKSQCLSVQPIETEFGRKTAIHQSSCNVDYSCMEGDCPSFLQVDIKEAKKTKRKALEPPQVAEPTTPVRDRFSVHMAGIGGTGVISVSGIVAEAALIEGRRTRSLDLTGSTIKAGPVISQVQVFPESESEPTAVIEEGAADVVLVFDLLALMTPENLAPLSPERTVVVASSSVVPNAAMAIDPSTPYPSLAEFRANIDKVSLVEENRYLDAQALALAITGNHMSGNALMLGVAVQSGGLPLKPASVEQAIRRHGVAVEATLIAFTWGRAIAADPTLVDKLLPEAAIAEKADAKVARLDLSADLTATVSKRYVDLVGFQGRRLADTYLKQVGAIAERDRKKGDGSFRATKALAENLHKLMAYKDEYEVARLHLDSVEKAEAEFGKGAKVSFKLHPPVLKAFGMHRKITLGPWFALVFVLLAKMKFLRGTPLDIFGHMKIRRIERALIADYSALAVEATKALDTTTYDDAVDLLRLAEGVRGYEDVKIRNLHTYLHERTEAAKKLGMRGPDAALVEMVKNWKFS